jgi:hypothetical protein
MRHKDQDSGLIKLFDYDGVEIPASRKDLLKAEAQTFNVKFWRRLVGDRSGNYWLISNRPGFNAMLLKIWVFHSYPRTGNKWSVSFTVNGIAHYPHWELETVLKEFRRETRADLAPDPNDYKPIPPNVEQLAREHVTYRPGRGTAPDPLDKHGIQTLSADKMRRSLAAITNADTTELVEQTAGQRIGIFELYLSAQMFCGDHGLDEDQAATIARRMVPATQYWRLLRLTWKLGSQLAAG